jgi:sulfatase modifying factor 1
MHPLFPVARSRRRNPAYAQPAARESHESLKSSHPQRKKTGVGSPFIPVAVVLSIAMAVAVGCSGASERKPPAAESSIAAATPLPDPVNYTETIPDTKITFDMIAVPGGTFLMGSPESESGRKKDEDPQHEVTVFPFWIGKVEVTWDEYDAFRDACQPIPRGAPESDEDVDGISGPTPPYGDPYRGFSGGNQPVIGVSWHAAMTYCLWLSQTTGKLYRLPTEAEWEYACRAGSKSAFSYGDDPATLEDYAWFKGKSDYRTHPVGSKKPNAWGIYDMHGNVSEWCLDWYQPEYYGSVSSGKWPPNPRGPQEGKNHAIRGGHFGSADSFLRSAARDRSRDFWLQADPQEPKSKWWLVPTNYLGFRIVHPLQKEEFPVRSSNRGL